MREVLTLFTVVGICVGLVARTRVEWSREQQMVPLYGFLDVRSGYAGPEWLRRLLTDNAY